MKLLEFDYFLPKGRIAKYPLDERDSSRLMVLRREVGDSTLRDGSIEHRKFKDLVDYLRAGDVLVVNNTKVMPVRLYGKKPTGGKAEILLIRERGAGMWEAIVRGQRQGRVLFENGLSADVFEGNSTTVVRFTGDNIKESIYRIGHMPLPPYIKRDATEMDRERYQTVYAEKEGAIAAPTAGLHFTEKLLKKIRKKGVEICALTLHVGYGTFKPVLIEDIEDHRMDEEFYEIPASTAISIASAKSEGRRVIAAGTTTTRALESAFVGDGIRSGAGKTSLFIFPGYKFKAIDALITNFHLPKSTPMILTAAFSGLAFLRKAYSTAFRSGYRFFSYGDAMLIL